MSKIKVNDMTIEVTSRALGLRYDPYDETTITVTRGSKTAVYVQDGLGTASLTLIEGDVTTGTLTDRMDCGRNRTNLRKMFSEYIGIWPDEAIATFNYHSTPDPMGSPESYR
jgi:hypothetical protein